MAIDQKETDMKFTAISQSNYPI